MSQSLCSGRLWVMKGNAFSHVYGARKADKHKCLGPGAVGDKATRPDFKTNGTPSVGQIEIVAQTDGPFFAKLQSNFGVFSRLSNMWGLR